MNFNVISIINSMIDFVAFFCIILSLLLIARNKRVGWWIGCIGQVFWIMWSLVDFSERTFVLVQSVVLFGLNLYGGIRWKQKS
jgi:hypothetical protein